MIPRLTKSPPKSARSYNENGPVQKHVGSPKVFAKKHTTCLASRFPFTIFHQQDRTRIFRLERHIHRPSLGPSLKPRVKRRNGVAFATHEHLHVQGERSYARRTLHISSLLRRARHVQKRVFCCFPSVRSGNEDTLHPCEFNQLRLSAFS